MLKIIGGKTTKFFHDPKKTLSIELIIINSKKLYSFAPSIAARKLSN